MAAGWWRDTSDNKLVAAADSEFTVPTGHDFILKTTIEAAYDGEIWQGGTWDGTDYEPPDNILVPYDTSTDLGRKQIKATILHEWLHGISGGVHAVRHEKPQIDVQRAEQFIAMAHWANYVVAHICY